MVREPSRRVFWDEDFSWEDRPDTSADAPAAAEPGRPRRHVTPAPAPPPGGATRRRWDTHGVRDATADWRSQRTWAIGLIAAAAVLLIGVLVVLAFDIGESGSRATTSTPTSSGQPPGTASSGPTAATRRARAAAALAAVRTTSPLHQGVSGRAVRALQAGLAAAGIRGVPQTGTYGGATTRAVR